ncbi:MAG: hypothetical protein IPK97_21345 [Ahniella sp.]|nr:hypothetical protein [Ahniella sp.]
MPSALVKLLDFGIAKVLSDNAFRNTVVLTRDNAGLTTSRYASPGASECKTGDNVHRHLFTRRGAL